MCLMLCLNHCDLKNMIFVHQEDDHLIRVRLQSRHTSSRTYLLWIEYSPTEVTTWYCKCRAGARVVGVCSHIASILWYLGYARHKPHISYGVRNWGEHLADASHVIDHTDNDQSVIEEWDPTILLESWHCRMSAEHRQHPHNQSRHILMKN
jgi:hypothetical protein